MILKNIKINFLFVMEFILSAFSLDEFKRFLNDNHGGLVLSFDNVDLPDKEWIEYKQLKADDSAGSVNPNDLPDVFCEEACRVVDEFHRKTINEKVEWMMYFDYTTGEVIYCWKGEEGKAIGGYEKIHVNSRKIASIHSHPKGYYSFPSPNNFDILENSHEDFEIIVSVTAFWILKFNGKINKTDRRIFQQALGDEMAKIISLIRMSCAVGDIDDLTEELIGNYLLDELDKDIQGINLVLVKKEYV